MGEGLTLWSGSQGTKTLPMWTAQGPMSSRSIQQADLSRFPAGLFPPVTQVLRAPDPYPWSLSNPLGALAS